MDGWHDYMVSQAGAAAALAGFIFVGLSINLERILKYPAVLNRAAAALTMLMGVLLTASLMLVPDQSFRSLGVQALMISGVAWAVVTVLSVGILRDLKKQFRRRATVLFALRQIALLPILIGGVVLATNNDDGLQWIVRGFTLTFVVTLVEAWVILVEINR